VRRIPPLLGFLLALAGLLAADEGWRGKPYTEWTGKEVEDVLDHSPWVRQLTLVVLPTLQDRNACPVSEPRCGIRQSPEAAEGVYETQGAGPPAERRSAATQLAKLMWSSMVPVRKNTREAI
jgi:hypothetical protein